MSENNSKLYGITYMMDDLAFWSQLFFTATLLKNIYPFIEYY